MKRILVILLTLISFASYSQQQVDSSGQLAPLGNFPVTSSKYVKGANRSVKTIAARNAIPMYLRDTGMVVYVTSIDSSFILKTGISDTSWKVYKTGSATSNAKTIIDTVETSGASLAIKAFSGGGRVISLSVLTDNGSSFLPKFATVGDTTIIYYPAAPSGEIVYKLSVVDASDTVRGGGSESGGGGGTGGVTDTLYIYHKDTTFSIIRDTNYSITRDTIVSFGDTLFIRDTIVVYTDTSGGSGGPVDYNTLLNRPALKTVATTGSYPDLINRPAFATVATSGLYSDLAGRPTLATVSSTGSYTDLINRPSLSSVATTGSYTDLLNKPALKTVATSGLYSDLTGKPTLSTVATTGNYADILNLPALKTVATSGLYNDLTGRPTFATVATSGSYIDLTNRPTFATVATTGNYTDLTNRPTFATVATSGLYSDLAGKPTLATVATTGSYNDLSSKPTIPVQLNLTASSGVIVTGTYPNLNAKIDTNYLNTYLTKHAVIGTGSGSCYAVNTHFGLLSIGYTGETLQAYQLTQRTADSLGVDVIRQGLLSGSTSNYNAVTALLNSNRQVQLNIRNTAEDGTRNFTSSTERAAYVTYLDTLFRNTLAPNDGDTLIVCANEEANKGYHTLDTSANLANQSAFRYWFNELKPMDSIANLYGSHFRVANGGATGEVGWYFVWRNLMDSGRTADANEIAQAVFAPGTNLTNFPSNASFSVQIAFTKQLLPFIRTSGIEYWNWHIKQLTSGKDTSHINADIIALGAQAWNNLTGKSIICNELSSTSTNPNIIAEELADCVKAGMEWVLMFDNNTTTVSPTFGSENVSFRNSNNTINAVGVNVRNIVQALKR